MLSWSTIRRVELALSKHVRIHTLMKVAGRIVEGAWALLLVRSLTGRGRDITELEMKMLGKKGDEGSSGRMKGQH